MNNREAAEHRFQERAAFISAGYRKESMALGECTGCRVQPWQVRDRDGQIVRFYVEERGHALFRQITRSRSKIVALKLGG